MRTGDGSVLRCETTGATSARPSEKRKSSPDTRRIAAKPATVARAAAKQMHRIMTLPTRRMTTTLRGLRREQRWAFAFPVANSAATDGCFRTRQADDSQALTVSAPAALPLASTSHALDPSSISFSNLDFATVPVAPDGADGKKKKKNRHALPKDANQALEVLAKRKESLAALEPEQREKREERDRWDKAALKAEGGKVRDDEKRLKKMAKRQERVKSKSAKAWFALFCFHYSDEPTLTVERCTGRRGRLPCRTR